jgi:DNA-binding NarL/FixJ family response regulator
MTTKRRFNNRPYAHEQKIKVLQMLSDDKPRKEIAAVLDIPPRSVERILSQLRKSMSCSSNERLIKLAIEKNLIS